MSAIALTAEKFAAAAERLPTTPQIFSRLSAAMKNPDISVEEALWTLTEVLRTAP